MQLELMGTESLDAVCAGREPLSGEGRERYLASVNWRYTMPPGLRAFCEMRGLSDDRMWRLNMMWFTIRGKKPTTEEEWDGFYNAVKNLEGIFDD